MEVIHYFDNINKIKVGLHENYINKVRVVYYMYISYLYTLTITPEQ